MNVITFITSLSVDIFFIGGLFVAGSGLAYYLNKGRMKALLFACIGAYALYVASPFTGLIGQLVTPESFGSIVANSLHYALFLAPLYKVLERRMTGHFSGGTRNIIEIGLLGVFFTAFVLVILFKITPLDTYYDFIALFAYLFTAKYGLFWWFIAYIVSLFTVLKN